MRKNNKTIKLAEIRRLIRLACRWYESDKGMPTFYSSDNYKQAKRMKGLILRKDEQDYVYYTKSNRAIEEIARKIYEVFLKRKRSKC